MTLKKPGDLTKPKEIKSRRELDYEWIAKYKDGTELKQYNDKKQLVHHFGHIDREKITKFILESKTDEQFTVSVDLTNGTFYVNGEAIRKLKDGDKVIPLGISFANKKIESPWGDKAKLIYVRHVRRDFDMGRGTMGVKIIYELGYEVKINGKPYKFTLLLDNRGHIGLPITPEEQGFKAL